MTTREEQLMVLLARVLECSVIAYNSHEERSVVSMPWDLRNQIRDAIEQFEPQSPIQKEDR